MAAGLELFSWLNAEYRAVNLWAWAKESFDLGTISANFHPRESWEIQLTPFEPNIFFSLC